MGSWRLIPERCFWRNLMATTAFILVEVRNVYGNETIYPACDKAQAFCAIAGTRTLPRHLIKHIQALGFEVRLAPQITIFNVSDVKVSG